MEKANKQIVYEFLLVNNAFQNEIAQYGDEVYSRYHSQNANWYRSFADRFNSILGFTGRTKEEFMDFISTIQLSSEQNRELAELRKEPMFKKLMGETALQEKAELEKLLGTKITSEGKTFADENGAMVAIKTEQQLLDELNAYSDKLSELLDDGVITVEQYEKFDQTLDYIYGYYISCSKGENIPFRKISNLQYEQIDQRAIDNGLSFEEQLNKETEDLIYMHEKIQKLQGHKIGR